jgi:HEAT repeat protein
MQGGKRMRKHGSVLSSMVALCFVWTVLLAGTGKAASGQTIIKQISTTIAIVRNSEPSTVRTRAAEQLADLTRTRGARTIDEKTLADLICLMDTPDDSVRFWVATSLGNLGTQAKAAIPKLETTLTEVDCLNGAITSAIAIRQALKKIGVTPPPPAKCPRIAG